MINPLNIMLLAATLAEGSSSGPAITGLGSEVAAVAQNMNPPAGLESILPGSERDTMLALIFAAAILIFFSIAIITVITANKRSRKCKFCSAPMKVSGYETTMISRDAKLFTTIFTCPKCGNVMTRTNTVYAASGQEGVAGEKREKVQNEVLRKGYSDSRTLEHND